MKRVGAMLVLLAVIGPLTTITSAAPWVLWRPGRPPRPVWVPVVAVVISPSSASVKTGASQQFTATVSNTGNTAVTWQVNGVTGGYSTIGYISNNGLYTAPSQVPNPAQVQVTATSQADPTKQGSATVTILSQSAVDLTGNWQISATSALAGPGGVLAGSIAQSGTALSGVMHIYNSLCYDFMTSIPFTGVMTSGTTATVTTTAVQGQIITANLNAAVDGNSATGTYGIAGGCANGDTGTLMGYKVKSLSGTWKGSFTDGVFQIAITAVLTQSGPDAAGYYHLTGTASFSGSPCFATGTISSGTSAVNGGAVVLYMTTSNGTVSASGMISDLPFANTLSGEYSVIGGTCAGDAGGGTLVRQ